jgi:glyoxylase-like metal-dependent hydrolase (beta-lactamase superfamily II)
MGQAGALIIAHDNVRRRMSTKQFIEALKREIPASPAGALPVVTFNDGMTLHINGDDVEAKHIPAAHTDGDAVVYFRSGNVIHMGDVFVRYGYPLIDLSSGGSLSGMIRGVEQSLSLINDSTIVIPGHGRTATAKDLREYRDMLVTVRDRVRRHVAAGATLDRILASKPTADLDKRWNGTFIKADDFVRVADADARASLKGVRPTRAP